MLNITEHFCSGVVSVVMDRRFAPAFTIEFENAWYEMRRASRDFWEYLTVFPDMLEHISTLLHVTWCALLKQSQGLTKSLDTLPSTSSVADERLRGEIVARYNLGCFQEDIVCYLRGKIEAWRVLVQ